MVAVAWNEYRAGASGGQGSLLPRALLDWEGRRFLAGTGAAESPDVSDIRLAVEPVRVYAGVQHDAGPAARAALVARELQRLRPVPPRLLLVGSPTGTGYVSSAATCAAELLMDGDCACIASQHGTARSQRSTESLDAARASLVAIVDAVGRLTRDGWRPERVVIWAESLGGWVLADALARQPDLLDAVSAPTAVAWVAPPGPLLASSALRAAMEARVAPDRIWSDGELAASSDAGDVLLVHRDDPVAHAASRRLLLLPQHHDVPGAGTTRRFGGRSWRPVTTALRARREIDVATRPGPRVKLRRVHDYRYAALALMSACLGLPAPSASSGEVITRAELWAHDAFERLGPAPAMQDPWRS